MKFIYILFFILSISASLWAQKAIGPKINHTITSRSLSSQLLKPSQQSNAALAGSCDTVNYPVPDEWNATVYYSLDSTGTNINGFITGCNGYGDLEKAAYFDMSNSGDNYVTKVWIAFAVANSNRSANLTKIVPIHIYDGTTGEPGDLLATVNKTLAELKADVDANNYTVVNFPNSIALPASKKFFVSVDLTNLTWSTMTNIGKDSLAIFASDPNAFMPDEESNGFGFENYQNGWETFADGWGADFSLVIHPFVCTDAVFPIRLLSFNGSREGDKNIISWTTASESGNAGFTLQRSANGVDFINIANLTSKAQGGNSSVPLSYSYTDAKGIAGNNFYRLKQTDISGHETYSSIVNIKASAPQHIQIANAWPSPAADYIKLLILSPSNDKIQLSILDLSGKTVSQKTQQVSTGNNTVVLNTNSLAPGTYFVKIGSSNKSPVIQKFLKE